MSTEIYYFSGTGNSLFVARELQRRLPDCQLIPIVTCLGQRRTRTAASSVGLVFPVHALTIPIAVKQFLERADFGSAEYVFAVATRLGTVFRGFRKVDRLLRRQHRQLAAHFILNMCNNEARHGPYQVPTPAEMQAVEQAVMARLDQVQEIVQRRQVSRPPDDCEPVGLSGHPLKEYLLEQTVLLGMAVAERVGGVNYFYTDDKCVGCGVCERVCLSQKIRLVDRHPVWQRSKLCYMCFACLNYCPRQAVQVKDIPGVKSSSQSNGRYPHPYATVEDIAAQKPD